MEGDPSSGPGGAPATALLVIALVAYAVLAVGYVVSAARGEGGRKRNV